MSEGGTAVFSSRVAGLQGLRADSGPCEGRQAAEVTGQPGVKGPGAVGPVVAEEQARQPARFLKPGAVWRCTSPRFSKVAGNTAFILPFKKYCQEIEMFWNTV